MIFILFNLEPGPTSYFVHLCHPMAMSMAILWLCFTESNFSARFA